MTLRQIQVCKTRDSVCKLDATDKSTRLDLAKV
jgi:hypothetical protein